MGDVELTSDDFLSVLKDIGGRFPSLKHDDLFVLWFLRSYITDSEELTPQKLLQEVRETKELMQYLLMMVPAQ